MKPKVGEVWLMRSCYSWGQCLVEITCPRDGFGYATGRVLDAEKGDLYFQAQISDPNYVWTFYKPECVRRVE